ncbi:squalene synthase HpnC [Planctomicrobium piriforme]|uniref:Squalene synthase HpnC n=1 Tax=Planctomicrobium piriforme TaxID=1576369 RepID=A0A1I3P989_9PLAN|nr:squalene synthase HpnC [Planctomicrobium piriforme]SFJ18002.1 squalene synthase HpnC [Planctomicrobium piriforme]
MVSRSVIDDLAIWGPDSSTAAPSQKDAEQYCRTLATSHYENFPVVSWLLPRSLHQHFYNVYAFCRWADDLGDETGSPQRSLELLQWWQTELDRCYAGETRHPVFVALRPTIERFSIPKEPFADLISAFVQDQSVREYETYGQLLDYCRRSANPVGRLVLSLVDRVNEQTLVWSDSICTGLQLANFWQDIARDDAIARVYLPREDRDRFGYPEVQRRERRSTPEFQALMQFEVDRARQLLLAGKPLVGCMPGRVKLDINLFIQGGLLILDAIERIDYRVWEQRPVVRKSQFALAALKSLPLLLGERKPD